MSNSLHQVVCFGESLWDILPSGKQVGGAPLNVAYHLHKLGQRPAIISRIGFDDHGQQLIQTMERHGVCTDYFQVDYNKPTGVVTGQLKNEQEMVYTIAQDAAWDHIEKETEAAQLVQQAQYFVYGSLAARSTASAATLFSLLDLVPCKVFDMNLRAPFYNRNTLELLMNRADILKLNIDELELVTGWFSPLLNITDRIKSLQTRFGFRMLIVTCGAKGAIVACGDEWYSCKGLPVKIADTVGCGDAFLAALLCKQLEGATVADSLAFANQLAAFIGTQQGACPDYHPADISPQLQ
ncbi:carbohydrate kinase family protein [Deminuibacter soli]|uniref:Carbohydrate kinase n=1 Tax=Deminuibacter soli TaxID=2291815 RepID=A0A3E1NFW5_9BACT|nr:carbohydrate kinase [Deminuibacter soli]RFM26772.1 carbohydrate kinase [Deminuibacter soli]